MYLTAHGPKFNYDLPVTFNSGLGNIMVDHQKTVGGDKPRAGKQFRSNTDRYFHVMGQGWYALVREGINGPYLTKEYAREFVNDLIRSMVSDEKKESWRHNPI